jgi:hypothetical protein
LPREKPIVWLSNDTGRRQKGVKPIAGLNSKDGSKKTWLMRVQHLLDPMLT